MVSMEKFFTAEAEKLIGNCNKPERVFKSFRNLVRDNESWKSLIPVLPGHGD